MMAHDELDDPVAGIATVLPSTKQKQAALAIVAVVFVASGVVAPFAATPLPRIDAFIPSLQTAIFITDLITSVMLFVQFSIYRSRALLVLATGYLFTALIVIPYGLTFPGAFSPTGLLGAGLQSAAWLYNFWHLGFPVVLLVYAWLKDEERTKYAMQGSTHSIIGWSAATTISLVCGFTWLATAGDWLLPRIFVDRTNFSPLLIYVMLNFLTCALALVLLWTRRRSVLDLWLVVVACALIAELVLANIFTGARFTLGFYITRILSLVTTTVVLVILLIENGRLYARLAHSNMMLRRERSNKLMNLEAATAAISHEIKQPLTTIALTAESTLLFLEHVPPDLEEARSTLNEIVSDSHRASQILDNIRDLFRIAGQKQEPIDVNEISLGVLRIVRGELEEHGITTDTELASELPLVMGHRGQLQEVLLNLIYNAIDSMSAMKDGSRVLRVKTDNHGRDAIIVAVEDSGSGIDPEKLDHIFDAFVTTKPQGMGLGLAICRMIIEHHGGRLSAWCSRKGGALFQIILPIKSDAGSVVTPI